MALTDNLQALVVVAHRTKSAFGPAESIGSSGPARSPRGRTTGRSDARGAVPTGTTDVCERHVDLDGAVRSRRDAPLVDVELLVPRLERGVQDLAVIRLHGAAGLDGELREVLHAVERPDDVVVVLRAAGRNRSPRDCGSSGSCAASVRPGSVPSDPEDVELRARSLRCERLTLDDVRASPVGP